ncbi:MAG: lipase family protein [bacterium]|nr:lipase family protein [bacterium]
MTHSEWWRGPLAAIRSRLFPAPAPNRELLAADGGLNYDFAVELLRLIGHAYVEYFATRYGLRPEIWKPASARFNYGRYLPAETPAGFQAVCTINLVGGESRWPIGRILRRGAREFYIVFRGTVSEEEWIKDILVMQTDNTVPFAGDLPSGRAHLGFSRMFRRLDPPPEQWSEYFASATGAADDASANDSARANDLAPIKLFITGHSLGGALGTLAALQYHAYNPTLLTFGAPRPGDPAFAATFNTLVPDTLRIANHWDPVTDLPDADVDLLFRRYSYAHVGRHFPVFALSQIDGPAVVKIIDANENWRDWKDYVLETLLNPESGHRIDPLFAHQLRAYEYALDRDRRMSR